MAKPAIAAVGLFCVHVRMERLLQPAAVHGREPGTLDDLARARPRSGASTRCLQPRVAATLMFLLPVALLFFFAQKVFIEGIAMTGSKGMKIAVVGGGGTYTPGARGGVSPRRGDFLASDELVLHDIDPERLEVVGGLPADPRPPGLRRARSRSPATSRSGRRCRAVLVQLRVGGQAARLRDETLPRVRLRRPGDDRRGRPRQGAADGAGRAGRSRSGRASSPRRTPGSSTSPTRSASSPGRCSTRATAPSACATSRSTSSAGSPRCSASRPSGSSSTRPASTTSPGSAPCGRRPDCSPSCSPA